MKHLNVFLTIVSTGMLVFMSILLLQRTTTISAQTPTTAPTDTTIPILCPDCNFEKIGSLLKGKDLTDAYMPNTKFGSQAQSADLRGTIFNHAYLEGTNFAGLLSHMKFRNAFLRSVSFDLNNGVATDMVFKNADMPGDSFSRGSFQSANFTSANLTGADFNRDISMTGCDFTGANLSDSSIAADMSGSNMTGADAERINFNVDIGVGANLTNVNFTNANLTGSTNMMFSNLTGVTWSNTTCPDGTNSNNNGNTCVGHL